MTGNRALHTGIIVSCLIFTVSALSGHRAIAQVLPAIADGSITALLGQSSDDAQQAASGEVSRARVARHVPDPFHVESATRQQLARARQEDDHTTVKHITSVLERVSEIQRERQMPLTLEGAIQRMLANNYTIEVFHYNPAIETARVVEAQAAFDAIFAASITKNNVDRPTASELLATDLDQMILTAGVRQLLPTGALVSGTYSLRRTKQAFAFQIINPEYFSALALELRQPLLRNFGIDYNRSLIVLAKNDRQISTLEFRRQVRDKLRQVEELYWRLLQARRDVMITAHLIADFEAIYEYLQARQAFDVTPVQIAATKADLEQARADFVVRLDSVFDAQDRLIAVMNDPEINLADRTELIPEDSPILEPMVVDRLAEVQTALDHRSEVRQQTLRVANAKVALGRAKSAELPRFDLTFRVTYDGLAGNADRSFDELSRRKFIEYFVGVELETPVGNRGPRAARRRAELTHAQARSQLKQVFEDVILDVNLAVRQLETSYDQIGPSLESADARQREVESIVARAERKDFNTLINELSARQRLANIRRSMLNAVVEYNIAIVDLERATGTLLEYNNVVLPPDAD